MVVFASLVCFCAGKYGIIQMADKYAKQREFEAWLAEVKKAPGAANGAQWEVVKHDLSSSLL